MHSNTVKIADTKYPVLDVIKSRWSARSFSAHPLAGFSAAAIKESFGLNETLKPVTVIALGYLDDAEKLEEPFKSRELTPRKRKPLAELILNHSN